MKTPNNSSPNGKGAAAAPALNESPGTDWSLKGEPEPHREERVAELRRRFQDGTLEVDPVELSAAIVGKHIAK